MISGTITDASGRTLSGQTTEAFWYSVAHARPIAIGLNCALAQNSCARHVLALAKIADTAVSAHPNAGLPDEFGQYNQDAATMAAIIGEFAESGLLNIVGGCCGTTPAHIRAIAERGRGRGAAAHRSPRRRRCASRALDRWSSPPIRCS